MRGSVNRQALVYPYYRIDILTALLQVQVELVLVDVARDKAGGHNFYT